MNVPSLNTLSLSLARKVRVEVLEVANNEEFENAMAKKLSLPPQAVPIIFIKWKQATYVS